jgi:hypothetical protein
MRRAVHKEDTSIRRLFKAASLRRLTWPLGQVVEPSLVCRRADSATNPTVRARRIKAATLLTIRIDLKFGLHKADLHPLPIEGTGRELPSGKTAKRSPCRCERPQQRSLDCGDGNLQNFQISLQAVSTRAKRVRRTLDGEQQPANH